MPNTLLDLVNRLPHGLDELYRKVDSAARNLGCNYMVVGATARDTVLVHGFGATLERGTRDVDFGIKVSSWNHFSRLKNRLLEEGFRADERILQRLYYESSDKLPWEQDIVPFGAIESTESIIGWPPDHDVTMSVLGFKEAMNAAWVVLISRDPDVSISVASPVGLCLLKLIAWLDRPASKRSKDAADIRYLIDTYPKIPEIFDRLFDEGHMAAEEWDETRASARMLGMDIAAIVMPETKTFLTQKLISQPTQIELMAREMSRRDSPFREENLRVLGILLQSIQVQA